MTYLKLKELTIELFRNHHTVNINFHFALCWEKYLFSDKFIYATDFYDGKLYFIENKKFPWVDDGSTVFMMCAVFQCWKIFSAWCCGFWMQKKIYNCSFYCSYWFLKMLFAKGGKVHAICQLIECVDNWIFRRINLENWF